MAGRVVADRSTKRFEAMGGVVNRSQVNIVQSSYIHSKVAYCAAALAW